MTADLPPLPPIHRITPPYDPRCETRDYLVAANGHGHWCEINGPGTWYHGDVTDHGPVAVVVLPEPSGPVVRQDDGWQCGERWSDDLAHAERRAAESAQEFANIRAVVAHLRARAAVPTLAEDVALLEAIRERRAHSDPGFQPGEDDAMGRILAAVDTTGTPS